MSGKYDKILKEILGKSIRVFVKKILGIDAVKITLLDTKMQITNEREADFILEIEERGKKPYISHIEIQANNYGRMPQRMIFCF